MTFDDIKEMQIGSKKVKEAWLNGRQVYPSEKRIMDSLVCWYDPGKQQCTNESMAENPALRDLSGNGHDATCYNFAWSGMSGIGGYAVDFTEGYSIYVTVIESTYKIVHCTTTGIECWPWHFEANKLAVKPFSVKISGLNGQLLRYYYYDGTVRKQINITSDGVYDLPESIFSDSATIYCGFYIPANEQSLNVLIEQLPKYPNALVSDGVDDYATVKRLPLLTKERGYTVIAKRKNLYQLNEKGILASKHNGSNYGAFLIEYNFNNINAYAYNFGTSAIIQISSSEIIYQTSKSYNGETSLNIGTYDDTSILDLFKYINHVFGKVALYSFLLFDRDLTTAEIEWVKTNMIEWEGVMKYDWLSSTWKSHLNKDNAPSGTGTVTSYRLTINSAVTTNRVFESSESLPSMESYKIQVLNLPEGVRMLYSGLVNGEETNILTISKDGIYEIPPINVENRFIGFRFDKVFENKNVIIQQLLTPLDQPLDSSLVDAWIFSGHTNEEASYEIAGEKGTRLNYYNFAFNEEGSGFKDGALHFDGVDDYLFDLNRKIPKLDEYTVICRRYVTPGTDSCTASKDGYMFHKSAFVFELKEGTDIKTYSFEVGTSIDDFAGKESVSWQTKNSYNGIKLESTNNSDSSSFMVCKSGVNGNIYLNGYIKYFALYDRTLSEGAIQAEIRKLEYKWEKRLKNK